MKTKNLNLGLLKLDLFCKGLRIDKSCDLERDARPILRTRGGLGSGLEIILSKGIYVNAPVEEQFVKGSPYLLIKQDGKYYIEKDNEVICRTILPPKPKFYDKRTSSGKLMSRIGVMQGTYLGIYPTKICEFWQMSPRKNCRFCSVGLNIGKTEELEKSVEDVLETVIAAHDEEKITFVHFNTGYLNGEELDILMPYIRAVKRATGLLVGVQSPPAPEFTKYDNLKTLGVEHVSFCFELYNPIKFREICPGKYKYLGQKKYFEAIEYCVKTFGRGRVAGEVIAGLEEPQDTVKAIEDLARLGAVATVCVFRPCLGTDLEDSLPPDTAQMVPIFKRMYEVCLENNLPINIAPNIRVSLVLLPEEAKHLVDRLPKVLYITLLKQVILRLMFRLYFKIKLFLRRDR
jgi:hypothetical protein